MDLRHRIKRNEAELGGLTVGLLERLHDGHYEAGTAAWAAQTTIYEKWGSVAEFNRFFSSLDPEQQQGWLSLLKGRSAEHLVAHNVGGEVHGDWNIPIHDVVTPEGDLIQVKTGSTDYILSSRQDISPDIAVHSGADGENIPGVETHPWTDEDLVSALREADDSYLTEILGGSLAVGTVLSGHEAYRKLRSGQITPNEAPRFFILKTAGNTVRAAIVGVTVTSSSPVIVTAGSAYLLYRNYDLVKKLSAGVYRAATYPMTIRIASYAGHYSVAAVSATGRGVYELARHPVTRRSLKSLANVLTTSTRTVSREVIRGIKSETTKKIVKESAHALSKGSKGLYRLISRSSKRS